MIYLKWRLIDEYFVLMPYINTWHINSIPDQYTIDIFEHNDLEITFTIDLTQTDQIPLLSRADLDDLPYYHHPGNHSDPRHAGTNYR